MLCSGWEMEQLGAERKLGIDGINGAKGWVQ